MKTSKFNLAILIVMVAAWTWIAMYCLASAPWWVFLPILSAGAGGIGYWSGGPFPIRIETDAPEPRLRYLPSVLLAMAWTLAWGACRWVRYACRRPGHFRPANCRSAAFMWGRHNSPKAIFCEECGWAGPLRWMVHGYSLDCSGEDVTPEDTCPKCGYPDGMPLLVRRNGTWSS
jgi:hypothetical protein